MDVQGKLPEWIKLPASVALPFGTFEEVMEDPINQESCQSIKAQLQKAVDQQEGSSVKAAIMKLQAPPQLLEQLQAALDSEGLFLLCLLALIAADPLLPLQFLNLIMRESTHEGCTVHPPYKRWGSIAKLTCHLQGSTPHRYKILSQNLKVLADHGCHLEGSSPYKVTAYRGVYCAFVPGLLS
jgi:hypothetical protein